jgi:hypothetical protein
LSLPSFSAYFSIPFSAQLNRSENKNIEKGITCFTQYV